MHDLPWLNFLMGMTKGCSGYSHTGLFGNDCPGIWRQGMFSDVIAVLGSLSYAESHDAFAVQLFMDTVDYTDRAGRGPNYWDYFYEANTYVTSRSIRENRELGLEEPPYRPVSLDHRQFVDFNGYLSRFGALGTFSQVSIGKRNRKRPFPLPNRDCGLQCGLSLQELSRVAQKYLVPNQHMQELMSSFWTTNIPQDAYVIGVHYRGTDKKLVWPFSTPTYSVVTVEVEKAAREAGQSDNFHVFLASDEEEIVHYFQEKFGVDRVSFQPGAPRLSSRDSDATEGGTHKSLKYSAYDKGLTAMLDMMLLSKCNYLVKNRSSLSDVSLLLGENLKENYSFILADNAIFRGTDGVASA